MCLSVSIKIVSSRISLITHVTPKRSIARMCQGVFSEISSCDEGPFAPITAMVPLSVVPLNMYAETARLCKPFPAHWAHVRAFPRVGTHVHDERAGAVEATVTDATCVTLLAGVCAHVLGELVGLAERFVAHAADVRAFPCVSAYVRG